MSGMFFGTQCSFYLVGVQHWYNSKVNLFTRVQKTSASTIIINIRAKNKDIIQ